MRAFADETLLLELSEKVGEKAVLTLSRRRQGAWQGGEATKVWAKRLEVRARNNSHQAHGLTLRAPQRLDRRAELAKTEIAAFESVELWAGEALQTHDEDR